MIYSCTDYCFFVRSVIKKLGIRSLSDYCNFGVIVVKSNVSFSYHYFSSEFFAKRTEGWAAWYLGPGKNKIYCS